MSDSLIGSGLSAGASLLGGGLSGSAQSKSDKKALKAQQAAQRQTREDLEPYRSFGTNSLADYTAWKASPAGKFRFRQPGRGDGYSYKQSTQAAPSLSADQIRQNLIGSGQFNLPDRATYNAKYGLNNPLTQEEATHQWGLAAANFGGNPLQGGSQSITEDFVNPQQYYEWAKSQKTGGSGGIDETALSQAIQQQLDQQARTAEYYNQDQGGDGGDFRTDPSYKFRLQEGVNTLQNSALAKGGLLSGNALRGINEFGQNLASTEYGKIYDREYQRQLQEYLTDHQRKFGDIGLGYSAAAGGADLNTSSANQIANTLRSSGANQANSISNAFSGVAGAIGDYYGNKQYQDFLDRAYPR